MNVRILRLACALLCCMVLSPDSGRAQASTPAPTQTARVNADAVRARESADLASMIAFSLNRGAVVEVLSREGVWSRIRSEQRTGYVRTSVLTNIASPNTPSGSPPTVSERPAAAPPATTASPVTTQQSPPTTQQSPPTTQRPPATAQQPPATTQQSPAAQSTPPSRPTTAGSLETRPPAATAQSTAAAATKAENSSVVGEPRSTPSHVVAAGVSYTPAPEAAAGSVNANNGAHIAGHLVLQLSKGPVGIFGVGGIGSGTGYKSQLANAGLSVALLRAGRWRFDVVGGGAYYAETLDGSKVADKATGGVAGAMLTLPLVGPLRGTVLGSYMIGKWGDDALMHAGDARFLRVVVGIGF